MPHTLYVKRMKEKLKYSLKRIKMKRLILHFHILFDDFWEASEMLHRIKIYKKKPMDCRSKKRPSKLRDKSRRDQCTSPPLQFSPAK
jgi:hypothetical protein